jgi:hypothetical protein
MLLADDDAGCSHFVNRAPAVAGIKLDALNAFR